MTPQELLKPRVICTGKKNHYPGSPFYIGEILHADRNGKFYQNEDHGGWLLEPEEHPHLFRPLQWWEHRKPEDMPEYVKSKKGEVMKVDKWHVDIYEKQPPDVWFDAMNDKIGFAAVYYQPATLEEYNAYLTQKQEQ